MRQNKHANGDNINIDVETIERIEAFCSSDEERESTNFNLFISIIHFLGAQFVFLPITPEIDDPEENPHLPIKDVTVEAMKEEVSSEINSDELKTKQFKRKNKTVKKVAKNTKRSKI